MINAQGVTKPPDSQWQGFEHFHDHQEKQGLKLSTIKQNPLITTNRKSARSSVSPNKNRTFVSKTKKSKLQKQPPLDIQRKLKQENKRQPSPQKIIEKQKKFRVQYERIPILKFQDNVSPCGSIIYRGFVPRSSDNYFRLMKEVDFTTSILQQNSINRKKIPDMVQFNSKFEGGNLNLACRGF